MVCRNHPERGARRRCYLCKSPVCPECQQKKFHHIFCGSHCAEAFSKGEAVAAADLPTRLEDLDRSLGDDLREQTDVLTDHVRDTFAKLEEELDQALTALATMVEGSAVAAASDLSRARDEIRTSIDDADRAAGERATGLAASSEKLRELALSARQMLLEVKEELERAHAKGAHDSELLQHRLSYIEKQAEERQSRLETSLKEGKADLEKRIGTEAADLGQRIGAEAAALGTRLSETSDLHGRAVKALHDRSEELADQATAAIADLLSDLDAKAGARGGELRSSLESQSDELRKLRDDLRAEGHTARESLQGLAQRLERMLADGSAEIEGKVEKQLQRIVDDIATLTVAQRGNWQEVVNSARMGAERAGRDARPEVVKRLNAEVEAMARHHSKELGKVIQEVSDELKSRARRTPLDLPRMSAVGFAGLAAGLLMSFLFSAPRPAVPTAPPDTSVMEERLRAWVGERLAAVEEMQRTPAPEAMVPVPAMTRGNTSRKEVAFTFDAGSNPQAAVEILDTLKARAIRTTMFLTGDFIQKNPEIVRRIAEDGHEAGNHLLEHNHVVDPKTRKNAYSKEAFLRQLTEVERAYREVTGREMAKLWRAPYGDVNEVVISWAASIGYRHVGWTRAGKRSLDSLDWVNDRKSGLYRTADQITANILDFEKADPAGLNGGVVLMHLGTERQDDFPHRKLPEILDEVRRRGYGVVPVSQVLRTDVAAATLKR